ncbi:MAG: YdeI/OmpD-associated family protein [Acidimicrobiia bacterium]|nr:YdeI/OmpD-associated family protein [Acidimicrobiia bacterium]
MTGNDLARLEVRSAAELRAWLLANHNRAESVWLVTFKKHVEDAYVSVDEILDELLCFGWVDGVRRKLDDDRTMQLVSPRRTQYWAKSYKERAARLIASGRMHESGLAAIEESKRSGLWNFMDDVDALLIPDDLEAALRDDGRAFARFAAFPPSYRRNVLRWVKLAKTSPTREKRIKQVVATSADNRRIRNL